MSWGTASFFAPFALLRVLFARPTMWRSLLHFSSLFEAQRRHPEQEKLENERRMAALIEQARHAQTLVKLASRLNKELDLDAVVNVVCEETSRALGAEVAYVTLYDQQRDRLDMAASTGIPRNLVQRYRPLSRPAYQEIKERYGPVIVVGKAQGERPMHNAELFEGLGIQTLATVSMLREGALIGMLSVAATGKPRYFDEKEVALLRGIADQAAMAVSNAHLFRQANQRLERVQALRDIDLVLTASLDLRLSLDAILKRILSQLHADAALILLFNPTTSRLEFSAGCGFCSAANRSAHVRLGEAYAGRAAVSRKTIVIPDLRHATSSLSRAIIGSTEEFVSYAAVPLIAKGQLKGVLEIFYRTQKDTDAETLSFLEALAGQAAIAIENVSMFEALERSNMELGAAYDATIEGWSNAMDLRDKETEGHTRRVTEMTVLLAEAMGMPRHQLVHIRRGALLHDIGKMGIPDSILLKPGPLNTEEWAIMRKHPVYAYELLSPIAFLHPALDIPYCHHERWDGSGYPRGLAGEQIPKTARIFAVVDVWDALTSDRPYRPAMPREKVLGFIAANSGTHFDPEVVEAFLKLFG